MIDRTSRISGEIKKELSNIIRNDLKDPRLPEMVSVVSVVATKDLRYAKCYISVLGNDEEKENAIKALKSAAGFIRREIGQRILIRYTPELLFELDNSIEYGAYINKLISKTIDKEKSMNDNGEKNGDVE